jgi:hypothetical protein
LEGLIAAGCADHDEGIAAPLKGADLPAARFHDVLQALQADAAEKLDAILGTALGSQQQDPNDDSEHDHSHGINRRQLKPYRLSVLHSRIVGHDLARSSPDADAE